MVSPPSRLAHTAPGRQARHSPPPIWWRSQVGRSPQPRPPQRVRLARKFRTLPALFMLACMPLVPASAVLANPILGLAYQPFVGQWSATDDNPFAPGQLYTPTFNSYRGGIALGTPGPRLWSARQRIDLYLDPLGRLTHIQADGHLTLHIDSLWEHGPSAWSQSLVKPFEGATALPAVARDHQGSVYRQLAYLAAQADGAPLTLTTYGTGFDRDNWSILEGEELVTFPVWAEHEVAFHSPRHHPEPNSGERAGDTTVTTNTTIDEILFHFPATAIFVNTAPERILVETRGTAGEDLALTQVQMRVFAPADPFAADATLNPAFFLGNANAQIPLAAAAINAQAGATLLRIKLGVPNILIDDTLVNERMRFAIRSALAQAQLANRHHPGTVTHLIISNEYAEPVATNAERPTPTQQVTEMVRFARDLMAADGAFAGLGLRLGVRSHGFRRVDRAATDPATQTFTDDVRALIQVADTLLENIYPSPEAMEEARIEGHWGAFFEPRTGELAHQWQRFEATLRALDEKRSVELMIGEIGHPSDGIPFNNPGVRHASETGALDSTPPLTAEDPQVPAAGIALFRAVSNPRLSAAFLTEAFQWSHTNGVQIHAFEAFDEPHKANQNVPLPGLSLADSIWHHAGPYGAEGSYGLFRYTGVAGSSATPVTPVRPGDRLHAASTEAHADGDPIAWAPEHRGNFEPKLPDFDFKAIAHGFIDRPAGH